MKTACLMIALAGALIPVHGKALTLQDCARTTHVSHGGEADHVDLGQGRVMWRDWWSQEGTASDIRIVECDTGEMLSLRTAEERMSDRAPFDRTKKALRIVSEVDAGARVFATLERIADALDGVARDIELATVTTEFCACAAAYPGLRGDKTTFDRSG